MKLFVLAVLVVSFPLVGYADDSTLMVSSDNSATWDAGIDDFHIEWSPDHTVNRIYSSVSQPVNIPDRQGINTAKTIAEEKAKAAIVRFMKQNVTADRLVSEVAVDVDRATSNKVNKAPATVTKEGKREMVRSLVEFWNSFASGSLEGIIVLERGYDEAEGEAWTKVGMSQKTIAAARGVQHMLDTPSKPDSDQASSIDRRGAGQTDGNYNPKREIRRSIQSDW